MTIAERATCPAGLRLIKGAERECPMYHARIEAFRHEPRDWAELICDATSGALRAVAQTIDNGFNKTVTAIAVVVIAAVIIGVGGMAVDAFVSMNTLQGTVSDMKTQLTDINQQLRDLNQRLDRGGNGGRTGQ
jgi:hypothetical protein